jgi:hypothetical protein
VIAIPTNHSKWGCDALWYQGMRLPWRPISYSCASRRRRSGWRTIARPWCISIAPAASSSLSAPHHLAGGAGHGGHLLLRQPVFHLARLEHRLLIEQGLRDARRHVAEGKCLDQADEMAQSTRQHADRPFGHPRPFDDQLVQLGTPEHIHHARLHRRGACGIQTAIERGHVVEGVDRRDEPEDLFLAFG